jgi:hypothetical protein
VAFVPYENVNFRGCDSNWSYDVGYQDDEGRDAFLRVEGSPHCPDDGTPDPGVHFGLGKAVCHPGDEVEVPIQAWAEFPPYTIFLAVEADAPEVQLIGAEVDVKSLRSGAIVPVELHRGEVFAFQECDVAGNAATCTYGVPGEGFLYDPTLPSAAVLQVRTRPSNDIRNGMPPSGYPGKTPVEIGRLRVKVPDDFAAPEIHLRNAAVIVPNGPVSWPFESGGDLVLGDILPAKEVRDGLINVFFPGDEGNFIRGDANGDGTVDLSDPVAVLGYLFLGGTLECQDSADADDSGGIDLTDPIFLLGALFLGSATIPPPFPGCGQDPRFDGLSCIRRSCQ